MGEDTTEDARYDSDGTDPTDELTVPARSSLLKGTDEKNQRTDGHERISQHASTGNETCAGQEAQRSTDGTRTDTQDASVEGADTSGDGTVFLVGSGPGDPELLTRRAWRLLQAADVVLHDSLTSDEIVDQLPESVEVIDVGKRPPQRTTQDEINELMLERAREDETVVRLKGGDPNVFGRGGEEAEHLAAEGVPFEIIPGVSSVLAAPSVSGIPLTHRDRSSSVTVITGHQTPDKDESAIDWGALADSIKTGGTLVILMGVNRLPKNVRALQEHGVPRRTPTAMVQKATWGNEKTVTGTLSDIVERSRTAEIEPPAVTIVGDVVDVRGEVEDWLRG